MQADMRTLYESTFYRITDFRCRCTDCGISSPEYSRSFCISFVRKGNFLFNVFRHSLDSYSGCVLVTKPRYEHTVTHAHTVPDECTIFDFRNEFYEELTGQYGSLHFFRDNDLHSTLVRTDPQTEFLHFYILRQVLCGRGSRLEIDNIIMDIIERILSAITEYRPDPRIDARVKKNHLTTIELAKEYITDHFTDDISLADLARHCHVSPFHFSRLFKAFTSRSPHRFLLSVRLQHAEMLLKNTALPIADIGFSSGFNSIEHFTAAFRGNYKCPPSKFRERWGLVA